MAPFCAINIVRPTGPSDWEYVTANLFTQIIFLWNLRLSFGSPIWNLERRLPVQADAEHSLNRSKSTILMLS